jgi:DNA topoisomerase-2
MADRRPELSKEDAAIAKRFKRLSQLDHIKLRPDLYVGQVESSIQPLAVLEMDKIVLKMVEYSPALFTIINEVLCNTLDEAARKTGVTKIEILLTDTSITVCNNGSAIPVMLHPEENNIYIPSLIFGHLLAGSNFNEDDEREGVGRNGLGVKLANVFSSEFRLRVVDPERKLSLNQKWTDGMKTVGEPKLRPSEEDGSVEVQFTPDAAIFGEKFSEVMMAAIRKRCFDLSVCASALGARVILNGERLTAHSFEQYAKMHGDCVSFDDSDPKWRVAVYLSESLNDNYGLLNGTPCGAGRHVEKSLDLISAALLGGAVKKAAGINVQQLKRQLRVLVVATVVNPNFNSQLKTWCSGFESRITWEPPQKMVKALLKSHLLDDLKAEAKSKELKAMARKTDGAKTQRVDVPKLRDAVKAGTSESKKCSLFLCEGDSAATFGIAGIGALDPNYFGCFPLKGKPLNVRDATPTQLGKNDEFGHLKKILALKQDKDSPDGLRYGRVIILSDSDADGLHIRGLVLNIFSTFWPKLLESGYVAFMPTPAVRVRFGNQNLDFETQGAFHEWEEAHEGASFNAKHVKGLGTLTLADAKAIFPQKRFIGFEADKEAGESMVKAFDKKKADDRKAWMAEAITTPPTSDYSQPTMSVSEFVNTDLVDYSVYSLQRAIPSMVDGLKTSQRKIIFTVFKRNMLDKTHELRVSQLAGAVSELTLYAHGEASLTGAITKLAQDFCGANNLALLVPNGMFGSRLQKGADAASPRYIYTYGQPYLRTIFSKDDEALLTFTPVEGELVEPDFYLPCIPMVLVNGTEGVATGYKTTIPKHEPNTIIKAVRQFIEDGDVDEFIPGYVGFKGIYDNSTFKCPPEVEGTTVTITELPPGISFNDWEEEMGSTKGVSLESNTSTEKDANFELTLDEEPQDEEALIKRLKLKQNVNFDNMWVFDAQKKLKKYESTKELLVDWCTYRMEKYEERLAHLRERAAFERDVANAKAQFILMVAKRQIDLYKQTPDQFASLCKEQNWIKVNDSWDYLLALAIKSLTKERAEALEREAEACAAKLMELNATEATDLWVADLDKLEAFL